MKTSVCYFIFMLSISSCSTSNSKSEEIKILDPINFKNALTENTDAILVDVRTADEFAAEYLLGATQLDFNADNFKAELEKLDKSKTYFVYCAAGLRSMKACVLMKELGFKNINTLEGGIKNWKTKNLPTKTENR